MHLFEFLDLPGLPPSLRNTLLEVLKVALSPPFRGYNHWVSQHCEKALAARKGPMFEMGAGLGPISQILKPKYPKRFFIPCDQHPPAMVNTEVQKRSFSELPDFPHQLLVFSACLHHLPKPARYQLLKRLSQQPQQQTYVFEPFRKSLRAWIVASTGFIPALLAPVILLKTPGNVRRLFWCWLFPVAPLLFTWDSLISVARQWTPRQWKTICDELGFELRLGRNTVLAHKI